MSKKIIGILPEISQYGVLHHFTHKVGEAFARQGYEVNIMEAADCFNNIKSQDPELLFSFNGAPQLSPGLFISDILDVPHFVFLVDPFYYYQGLLESVTIRLCCDDENDRNMLESYGKSAQFFTQGIEPEAFDKEKESKPLDIVFFGSFFDLDNARAAARHEFGDQVWNIAEEAIERSLNDETVSVFQAFEQALRDQNVVPKGLEVARFYYILSYVQKAQARVELLDSFKELNVHIWDGRWKSYFKGRKNYIVHDAVKYADSFAIMRQAKVVLCNSIRSVRGCNERVLNALACHALPVTNSNPFYKNEFTNNALLTYSRKSLPSLEDTVATLLDDASAQDTLINKGREIAQKNHTWDERIKGIHL